MRVVVELAGLAGAAYVVWLVTHVHDTASSLYRGGLTAAAVAAALVIVAAVQPSSRVIRPALSLPPLRWLGLISYGVYLFHWPIFLWLTPTRTGLYGWRLLTVRVGVTFAIAIASYVLVEMPVRRRTWRRPALTIAAPAVAIVAALVVATVSVAEPSAVLASTPSPTRSATKTAQATGLGRNLRVLVSGDSVAWTLSWFDTAPVARMGVDVRTNAIIGCGIGAGADDAGGTSIVPGGCKTWPAIYEENMKAGRPDLSLLVIGSWELLDHKIGNVELGPGNPTYRDYLFGQLDVARRILTSNGARLVVAAAPCFDVPILGDNSNARIQDDPARVAWLDGVLTDYANAHPADTSLVDFRTLMCPDGHIRDTIDGVQMRKDGMHYTNYGALVVWKWLTPQLQAIAAKKAHA